MARSSAERVNTPDTRTSAAPRNRVPPTGSARLKEALGADYSTGYLLVLPLVLLLVGLVAYPFIYSIYLSFTDKRVGETPVFVGLDNYVHLATDEAFWQAAINTLVFTAGSVALKLVLGMIMALVLNTGIKGRNLWTALLLIPWVTPGVIAALNWAWMYDALRGIINYLLTSSHMISRPIAWLGDTQTALPAVIVANVWRGFTFYGVTLLAALHTVPEELYEAAEIDGASFWQQFRRITLPHLRNAIIVVTLLSAIWTFNDFQQVWIMTQGGPAGSTQILSTLSYIVAFGAQHLGEAVSISIYLFPILAVIVIVLARFMQRNQQVQ